MSIKKTGFIKLTNKNYDHFNYSTGSHVPEIIVNINSIRSVFCELFEFSTSDIDTIVKYPDMYPDTGVEVIHNAKYPDEKQFDTYVSYAYFITVYDDEEEVGYVKYNVTKDEYFRIRYEIGIDLSLDSDHSTYVSPEELEEYISDTKPQKEEDVSEPCYCPKSNDIKKQDKNARETHWQIEHILTDQIVNQIISSVQLYYKLLSEGDVWVKLEKKLHLDMHGIIKFIQNSIYEAIEKNELDNQTIKDIMWYLGVTEEGEIIKDKIDRGEK